MKKKILYGLIAVLIIGVGIATWLIYTESSYTALVVSTGESPVKYTVDFQDVTINTTTTNNSDTNTATLLNTDGDLNLTIGLDVVKADDTSDTCTDYLSDCTQELRVDGDLRSNGDTIILRSGITDVESKIECKKLSCPQNISVSVSFNETLN